MRHYNKSLFAVKYIECDSKLKSIMDETRNEMGIEINYINPDDHVPE